MPEHLCRWFVAAEQEAFTNENPDETHPVCRCLLADTMSRRLDTMPAGHSINHQMLRVTTPSGYHSLRGPDFATINPHSCTIERGYRSCEPAFNELLQRFNLNLDLPIAGQEQGRFQYASKAVHHTERQPKMHTSGPLIFQRINSSYKATPRTQFNHPVLGIFREFTWCEKCQVVNRTAQWVAGNWCCPNTGCDAGMLSAYQWCNIYALQPAYPVVPKEGGYYPIRIK
jgi:hypothetical protein